ncbi:MAG: N-formylglutamate amidohydrolase [Planctomycetota bacterium]
MANASAGESASVAIDVHGGVAAAELSRLLDAPLIRNYFRNDLIDVGRSLGHRKLFGEAAEILNREMKHALIETVYQPYRNHVCLAIERMLQTHTFVVHLSVKSFAAKRRGTFLRTDIGLLYDPARGHEMDLCIDWIDEVYFSYADLKIRRNYPRRGTVDSLTKMLRTKFDPEVYLGIEVWLNQAWLGRNGSLRNEALRQLAIGLQATLAESISDAA